MRLLVPISQLFLMCAVLLPQHSSPTPAYAKREFKHQEKITLETKVEDGIQMTYVSLGPVFVAASDSERTSIRFDASLQYEGKTPIKPTHISIAFFNVSRECKIPPESSLVFTVDSHPLPFKRAFKSWRERKADEEGVAFSFGEMKGDRCHEFLVVLLSQKSFLTLVASKDVGVSIDQLTFKLTEANLEALRDLASRMVL